jgi:hypothetical protein
MICYHFPLANFKCAAVYSSVYKGVPLKRPLVSKFGNQVILKLMIWWSSEGLIYVVLDVGQGSIQL